MTTTTTTKNDNDKCNNKMDNNKMIIENVPILDLTCTTVEEQRIILDYALREYGFFYIKNYGNELQNLVERQFEMSKLLFNPSIVSMEEKTTQMKFNPILDIGYVGTNTQNLHQPTNRIQTTSSATVAANNNTTGTAEEKKDTNDDGIDDAADDDDNTAVVNDNDVLTANVPVGDTKEQFMQTNNILITNATTTATTTKGGEGENTKKKKGIIIDPYNVFDPLNGSINYVPSNIPKYSSITNEYASCCYRLNMKLNTLLFDCLQLSNAKRQELGYQPFIVLKQMKYTSTSTSSTSKSQLVGAGEHTDWGSFTILATDNVPGLQIYHNEKWLPVPPLDNCLIINSGDQISHLTNDYYKSALHRVVINNDTTSTKSKSNNSAASAAARYSTAVFTYFDMDAIVGPLPQFISSSSAEAANDDSTSNSNNNTKATGPCKYPYRTTKEYFHFKLHESFGVV